MRYFEDTALFEIPVYQCSWEQWAAERDEEIEKRASPLIRAGEQPDRAEAAAGAFMHRRSGGWDYTQAVGWIQLLSDGHDVIKGELWWTDKARIMRNPRPTRFEYEEKVLELWVEEPADGIATARLLRAELLICQQEHPLLRRRHLDLRAFDRLAPHVAWSQALGLGPSGLPEE